MLAKRIIPCLDVAGGRVVKGRKFKNIRDVDDPVRLAKYYTKAGADELVFYDITASKEERNIFINIVEKIAVHINIPFTVGGGIRSIEDFQRVLRAGADKVSINSSAVKNPKLIKEAALKFGRQCVVLSIDAKKEEDEWRVWIKGGRVDTGLKVIEWARKGESLGVGEIVLNSINTDGIAGGYSIDITRELSETLGIPVIASGGAGSKEDFSEVFVEGKADAALAASVFHYNKVRITELKDFLYQRGINVRRGHND